MNATERFSSRVENYVKYRPGYPQAVMDCLKSEFGVTEDAVIADIGSGTGIFTEMFLRNGNVVYAVEPNASMREAGEWLLRDQPCFHSIVGTAEATTLADGSVDLIAAGQAFHWFDRGKCKAEFKRILKPRGWVVLAWNERLTDASPFLKDYERLLQEYSTDYEQVNHTQVDAVALSGFFEGEFVTRTSANGQQLDFNGLKGRLLSSSYAPESGDPRHEPMLVELGKIFEAHETRGKVSFEYHTKLYCGRVQPA